MTDANIHPNRVERAPSETAPAWSAEIAVNELWAGLDATGTNGDVRRYLKSHLEAAFKAGRLSTYANR